MYSDCWAYKDSYLTQSQSEGSCSQYINDPACTVANRQCAYELDGFCLHENLTYSCEHKTTGSGVMCGGTFFCKDGSYAQAEAGKNNAFQHTSILVRPRHFPQKTGEGGGAAGYCPRVRCAYCTPQFIAIANRSWQERYRCPSGKREEGEKKRGGPEATPHLISSQRAIRRS